MKVMFLAMLWVATLLGIALAMQLVHETPVNETASAHSASIHRLA